MKPLERLDKTIATWPIGKEFHYLGVPMRVRRVQFDPETQNVDILCRYRTDRGEILGIVLEAEELEVVSTVTA